MNLDRRKQAEEAFLRRFPGGFGNPVPIATAVRKHKPDQMIAFAQESFSRAHFRPPDRIVQNMTRLVSRASIIPVFEKPRFSDFTSAQKIPENRGAGVRPHPCFRASTNCLVIH